MKRNLLLIAISMATWGMGEGMFFFFQAIYLEKDLHANPLAIGSILGAMGLAMTIAHIPAGYLADRIGRRPLLWASWTIGLLAAWAMALARTLPVFVVGLLLYGTTAFVMSPLASYVTTAAEGRLSVGRVLTLVSASYSAGAVLGPIVGGLVAERFGLRATYMAAACIFIVSTIIIYFISPQPIAAPPAGQRRDLSFLNWRYLGFLAITFLAVSSMYLPQPLAPNFLESERNLSLAQIGQLGSVASLGVVILNLTLGHLPARRGFLISLVLVMGFAGLLWRGAGLPWFMLAYFLVGGYRVARSMATAQTRELVQASSMGLAYSITETVNATATIVTPPLAGLLYVRQPELVYPVSMVMLASALVVSALFLPKHQPSKAAEAAQPEPTT